MNSGLHKPLIKAIGSSITLSVYVYALLPPLLSSVEKIEQAESLRLWLAIILATPAVIYSAPSSLPTLFFRMTHEKSEWFPIPEPMTQIQFFLFWTVVLFVTFVIVDRIRSKKKGGRSEYSL